MKLLWTLLFAIFLSGCFNLFGEKKDLIAIYKLDASAHIEIASKGYGATTKDFTEIRKITANNDELIKRLEGSFSNYKTKIVRINDTMFNVTFTDTSVFKGMSRTFSFNVDKK